MGRSLLTDPSSYLRQGDFRLGWDEDQETLDYVETTQLSCVVCDEALTFGEEILAIVVVQAQYVTSLDAQSGRPHGCIEFYAVLDDDGDFEYEPTFTHYECWADTCEEYRQLLADEPRQRSRSPAADLCRCSFCAAGIGAFQEFARVMLGECLISEKRGQTVFSETEGGSPEPVCLECMTRINNQCIELWK